MKFFVPAAGNEAERLDLYEKVKQRLREFSTNPLSDRKVYSLRYHHNGKPYGATVGTIDPIDNEMVVAIFYDQIRNVYLVCTPSRGVQEGGPKLVGNGDVQHAQDFE